MFVATFKSVEDVLKALTRHFIFGRQLSSERLGQGPSQGHWVKIKVIEVVICLRLKEILSK